MYEEIYRYKRLLHKHLVNFNLYRFACCQRVLYFRCRVDKFFKAYGHKVQFKKKI